MKKAFALILFIITSCNIFAQQTKKIENLEFDQISCIGKMNVELVKSDSTGIEIEFSGIEEDKISVFNGNNLLKIKFNVISYENVDAKITIYYKGLMEISANSGAIIVTRDTIQNKANLSLQTGTGGEIYLNARAVNVITKSNSSGLMVLGGEATNFVANAGTGGTINALDLTSENARVKAITNGKIRIHATKSISAKTQTGGFITFTGNPEKKVLEGDEGSIIQLAE